MKRFLLLAWVALPLATFSQHTLSGKITDKNTGKPLVGTSVSLLNNFISAVTNAQGVYYFSSLKEGSYNITASYIGYETSMSSVEIIGNTTLDLTLSKKSVIADEIIITATRASSTTPMAHTNLSKEELTKQNVGKDVPYLLQLTPSVVATSDAGTGIGYTGIRIRGTDATRINVTINGVPVNDAESQGVYWVDLPDLASSIQNVQVQRGVGTSTNGAGAFGGSINVQTFSLNPLPYAELYNSYGSFNTLRNTLNIGSGLIKEKWAFDVRLSNIISNGYIDRASSDLKSYYLSGGYYGKNTMVKAILFSGIQKTYQAWYGVPQDSLKNNRTFNPAGLYKDGAGHTKYYDNEIDNYQQDYYQLHFSKTLEPYWSLAAALHYTKGKGYYEQYKNDDQLKDYRLEPLKIGDSLIEASDIIRRRWLDNDFYGATYSLNYDDHKKWNITLGGATNNYIGAHFGEVIWARFASNSNIRQKYYNDKAQKSDANVFGKVTYSLSNKLTIFTDIQWRGINYTFTGYNAEGANTKQQVKLNFFNPKAGINYIVNPNHIFYTSFAVANREPSRNDYVESSSLSRPKPEQLQDVELGYKYQRSKFFLAFNYYLMNYKDQLVLTGQVNDVGYYTRTNIDKSYRTGIEWEGGINLLYNLQWTANATWSMNKIKRFREYIDNYDTGIQKVNEYTNTDIAFSPEVIAASSLLYEPLKDFRIGLFTKYVGKQYLDNASNKERMLNDYWTNDLQLSYTLHPSWIKEIEMNIWVYNIFNNLYESNGYTFSYISGGEQLTQNYYFPQAGTHFIGAVRVKF